MITLSGFAETRLFETIPVAEPRPVTIDGATVGMFQPHGERFGTMNTTMDTPTRDMHPSMDRVWLPAVLLTVLRERLGSSPAVSFDGRLTGTLGEHAAATRTVLDTYRDASRAVERKLRPEGQVLPSLFLIRFGQRMNASAFEYFVSHRLKAMGIGGYVTRRSPKRMHLAAIDDHLWRPFMLQVTAGELLGATYGAVWSFHLRHGRSQNGELLNCAREIAEDLWLEM